MATKRKLQVRYGAAASRPTLATGELGLDTGTGVEKLWIGTPAGNAFVGPLNTTGEVKRYVALLSQSGTSAPVATVLENTLGGTVVWTRTDVGSYVATLASAFTANKTVYDYNYICAGDAGNLMNVFEIGANSFGVSTFVAGGTPTDVLLENSRVEITVYP